MKGIRIYLVVVTILLVIALGFGVYTWYVIQILKQNQLEMQGGSSEERVREDTTFTLTGEGGSSSDSGDSETPLVIDVSTLSESQRSMLESFGVTGSTIVLTPAMVSCAREAVGETRLDEIAGGSAPSPLEALKLLPCFKK